MTTIPLQDRVRRTARRLALTAGLIAGTIGPAAAANLTVACSALGTESDLCREAAQAWADETGNTVEIVHPPNAASEQLALYQQLLAAESPDIDVLQLDVVWPGILGDHLLDLAPHLPDGTLDGHFPATADSVRSGDAILALPWFTDAAVLYYRSDLLAEHGLDVPETWDDLEAAAAVVQAAERAAGNDRFWGFVWQGRAYEGLTCNALEWVASEGGGTFIGPDGSITLDNPAAARALDRAAGWVGTLSPPGILTYAEEDARAVFQSGDALFMRNWPYAYALGQSPDSPIAGSFDVAPLPRGAGPEARHAATLGGQHLAVSAYTRHPDLAADLARFMTSEAVQRERAIAGSFAPTRPALYEDAAVLEAAPFLAFLPATLREAVARPAAVTGTAYNEASAIVYGAVHDVLSGNADGAARLAEAHGDLMQLSRGGRW